MKVTVTDDTGKTVEQELSVGTYRVGRGEGCEVLLDDETVSREHCIIEVLEGKCILRDLGSMNGTTLNDKRTAEADLKDGDVIALGRTKITVSLAAESEEEAKAPPAEEAEKPKEEGAEEPPAEQDTPAEEGGTGEESPPAPEPAEGGGEAKSSESES